MKRSRTWAVDLFTDPYCTLDSPRGTTGKPGVPQRDGDFTDDVRAAHLYRCVRCGGPIRKGTMMRVLWPTGRCEPVLFHPWCQAKTG